MFGENGPHNLNLFTSLSVFQSEDQNARMRSSRSKHQLAEILVHGHNHSRLGSRSFQDRSVFRLRIDVANSSGIIALVLEPFSTCLPTPISMRNFSSVLGITLSRVYGVNTLFVREFRCV